MFSCLWAFKQFGCSCFGTHVSFPRLGECEQAEVWMNGVVSVAVINAAVGVRVLQKRQKGDVDSPCSSHSNGLFCVRPLLCFFLNRGKSGSEEALGGTGVKSG